MLEILYCPVVLATKLSILLQLIHIFAPARERVTYYVCQIMIWFNSLFYTSIMLVVIFQCNPRAKFWEPTLPGHCISIEAVDIVAAAINVLSDVVLLLLPITCIWQLQMPSRSKLAVSAVFTTGLLYVQNDFGCEGSALIYHSACVSSIMRLVTSVQIVGKQDITWGIMDEGLWT